MYFYAFFILLFLLQIVLLLSPSPMFLSPALCTELRSRWQQKIIINIFAGLWYCCTHWATEVTTWQTWYTFCWCIWQSNVLCCNSTIFSKIDVCMCVLCLSSMTLSLFQLWHCRHRWWCDGWCGPLCFMHIDNIFYISATSWRRNRYVFAILSF